MSFSKTVSVFAALGSIFIAAATGWKLAQDDNKQPNAYEERIKQLEEQLKQSQQTTPPKPITLPQVQVVPSPPVIPPPPVPNDETP